MTTEISFPRQHSRTQRFTLGAPRSFTVAPDGRRVVFLRSGGGAERANLLQVLDLPEQGEPSERVAADPVALLGGGGEELTPQERARRERSRESSSGVVGYATDGDVRLAAFALSGRLFTAGLLPGDTARELPAAGPVLDPRPSPDGSRIAYTTPGGELRVIAADGSGDRALAVPDAPGVSWGQAEFIAQEEMDRNRGYWWSPQGDRLLAARVDDSPVQRWWIADPANPERPAAEVAYPRAGTPNAEVTLAVLGLDGGRVDVQWDRAAYPYLARAHWSAGGSPVILVQARDQRSQLFLMVNPANGVTTPLHAEEDPVWLDLFSGVPAWTPGGGRLVRISDEAGVRSLVVGTRVLTAAGLHVHAVLDVGADDVLISASAGEAADRPEVGEVHLYRVSDEGVSRFTGEPGHHTAVRSGSVTVLVSAALDRPGSRAAVLRDGKEVAVIASYAETPVITARPVLTLAGRSRIPAAVLLPTGYDRERDGLLPVLMNPYGGPHARQVLALHNLHLTSQWFADQGFAVVVADGRGTPGRSPAWEKSIAFDFAGATLDDQVEALQALAGEYPLDLARVAIRGWSYGGYLAALAVLRRPDVFHAAVAGAPVTEWELYDTHYTERYLGDPAARPEVYAANSLIEDAAKLSRPLQLIHGLADDNVVVAHSLRLSSALLAAGRPHEVLPLSGVTHMTPQEEVAENLLLLQVDFLRRSLRG
ncbi:S9 family peptidase [Streptacidiphilus sp. PB12-B1b]|uniref:S9 family peptidase n=1 Tax=Streptacidiphilus sp. PB12-B1b TaxID=2705012 RepID=UPI0015FC429A|nr:alpha/beta fold hydrolase [Streptacidiphilus sp. PB12-B1b]QMU75178.1 S9 family peptidase [Streptacidiphilus sp. PB12-B1b]